jgi:metallophosphoesterase (TIGR03767 family)
VAFVDPARITLDRTITLGAIQRTGRVQAYRGLVEGSGEPRRVRDELALRRSPGARRDRRSLAYFAHLTDIQLLDVQSPARLEMIHNFSDRPDSTALLPMQRPQELLAAHATDALVRAINALRVSPVTGASLQLAMTTGDNIDNMQWNEAQAYLRLLSGGRVRMDSGGPQYEGTQDGRRSWAWNPERNDAGWAREHGYPAVPGLISAGLGAFDASGLDVPWLTCHGNHDGLVQGRTPATEELAKIMTGDQKVFDVPPGPFGDFVTDPLHMFTGPSRHVQASHDRRPIDRLEFIRAHFDDGGPDGHGFTAANLDSGTAYFAYDGIPGVRMVVLDTTNPGGNFEGSIDTGQFAWLERTLAEVHRAYVGPDGREVAGGGGQRLVVIASHHSRTSMTNTTPTPAGHQDAGRRVLGDEVAQLLGRFPNVVAWISGHTHRHHVRPWNDSGYGFWEITTASVMEWPSQVRLLEIVENDDDTLSIVSTIVDHHASVTPDAIDTPADLASWHRELAANSPYSVGGGAAAGTVLDRNVELVMPDPRTAVLR